MAFFLRLRSELTSQLFGELFDSFELCSQVFGKDAFRGLVDIRRDRLRQSRKFIRVVLELVQVDGAPRGGGWSIPLSLSISLLRLAYAGRNGTRLCLHR